MVMGSVNVSIHVTILDILLPSKMQPDSARRFDEHPPVDVCGGGEYAVGSKPQKPSTWVKRVKIKTTDRERGKKRRQIFWIV